MVRARERKVVMPVAEGGELPDGFVYVKRTAYGHSEESTEQIRVPALAEALNGSPFARVRVGGGVTKNLGDFNSARVEVMIELPCLPESSEIDRVVALISAKLDVMIPAELDKATGGAANGQG